MSSNIPIPQSSGSTAAISDCIEFLNNQRAPTARPKTSAFNTPGEKISAAVPP